MSLFQARASSLIAAERTWQDKLQNLYREEEFAPCEDPEQQLYDGFIGDRDRRLCEQVRNAEPRQLGQGQWMFDDERLPELLFRYRARNFIETLNDEELQRWQLFCKQRLSDPQWGAPNTVGDFEQAVEECWDRADAAQRELLGQWRAHVQTLKLQFGL